MFRSVVSLDIKIADKSYQFVCDQTAPISEVVTVLNIMLDKVKEVQKERDAQIKAAQDAQKPEKTEGE